MVVNTAVEYTESNKRSLSAEEKLAQLNAKYNNLPEPKFDDEETNEDWQNYVFILQDLI